MGCARPWTVICSVATIVEPELELRGGVVVGVPGRPDRRAYAGVGEAIGVGDREVLDSAVGVVDDACDVLLLAVALPERVLEGVEGEVAAQRTRRRQPTIRPVQSTQRRRTRSRAGRGRRAPAERSQHLRCSRPGRRRRRQGLQMCRGGGGLRRLRLRSQPMPCTGSGHRVLERRARPTDTAIR